MGATPKPPKPPPFYPVDIQKAISDQIAADIYSWNYSRQDLAQRFPGLVAARDQQIQQAYDQLTGPLDPTIQNDFMTKGLETGLASTAGGTTGGMTFGAGSAAQNIQSVNVANNLQSLQDYYRAFFSQTLATNLPPPIGLSGADVGSLAVSNVAGANTANQQGYQSQLAGAYGAGQAGVALGQNIAQIGGIIASLGKSLPPTG